MQPLKRKFIKIHLRTTCWAHGKPKKVSWSTNFSEFFQTKKQFIFKLTKFRYFKVWQIVILHCHSVLRIAIVQITSQHKNIFPRDIRNHLNFLKRGLKNIREGEVRNLDIGFFSNYSFEHYVLIIGLDHILKNKFKGWSSFACVFRTDPYFLKSCLGMEA